MHSILEPHDVATTKRASAPLVLLLLTLVAYVPAMRGAYIWDDDAYVTANPTVRAPSGLRPIWGDPGANHQYYPLVFTTYWFEYRLWGAVPTGYHVVNVQLHACNAILLWVLLRRLSLPGAFLAAAVFALHPIEVETVAWIAERKTLLATLFVLLTALAWFRSLDTGRWRWSATALALFVAALLSKTAVAPLPIVLALLVWLRGQRLRLPEAVVLCSMLACALGLGLVTVWRERLEPLVDVALPTLTLVERILLSARAIVFYVGKLLWPADLMPIYPQWSLAQDLSWSLTCMAVVIAAVAVTWFGRHRWGRGPLVALLAFVLMLAPTLGLIPFNFMRFAYVADHFVYLPSIPFIVLVVAAAVASARRWRPAASWTTVVAATLLAVLGTLSWQQGQIYASAETFWRSAIDRNPQAWVAHNSLGYVLLTRGRLNEALESFTKSRELKPEFAAPYSNTGVVYLSANRFDEAIHWFEAAAHIRPDAGNHNSWAIALDKQGKFDEAIIHYQMAVDLDPRFGGAHFNLARVLWRQHRLAEAGTHLRAALHAGLEDPAAHRLLGTLLLVQGNPAEAVEQFAAAVALNPKDTEAQRDLAAARAELEARRQ